jgi:hypothetical protein
MNHTIEIIESIERLISIDLQPNIRLREEKACLMRMKANLAELKFLVLDTQAHNEALLR